MIRPGKGIDGDPSRDSMRHVYWWSGPYCAVCHKFFFCCKEARALFFLRGSRLLIETLPTSQLQMYTYTRVSYISWVYSELLQTGQAEYLHTILPCRLIKKYKPRFLIQVTLNGIGKGTNSLSATIVSYEMTDQPCERRIVQYTSGTKLTAETLESEKMEGAEKGER